jgi:hypothetical protein
MSFFDEARARRQELLAKEASNFTPLSEVLERHFKNLEETLYLELRDRTLEVYEQNGKIENLSFEKSWKLDWSIKSCAEEALKSHLKSSMEAAFLRLCSELGAQKRLRRWLQDRHSPFVSDYWVPKGFVIYSNHTDYVDENSYWSSAYSFSVSLDARFTPPLTD